MIDELIAERIVSRVVETIGKSIELNMRDVLELLQIVSNRLDALQEENDALKARLELLEGSPEDYRPHTMQ